MSIASAIAAKQQQVADSYTAVSNKGGTLPATQNLTNLATAISNIPSGGSAPVITSLSVTPTTSAQTITAPSGTDGYSPINVSAVTSAIDANITAENIKKDVQILGVTGTYEGSGGSSTKYGITINGVLGDVDASGVLQYPSASQEIVFTGVRDIASQCLRYKFTGSKLTSASFPALTTVSGSYGMYRAFGYCSVLTSLSFPKLTTVSGANGMNNVAYHCPFLENVSFPKLVTISGTYAMRSAFDSDTRLQNVYFNGLTTSSFGSYKNQFTGMMTSTGSTVTHTLHFPSNMQSTISGLQGYPLFGGTSGKVVLSFDLPATS